MALIFKRFLPICLFFYHVAHATDTLIPSGFTELGTANIGNANIGSFGGINSNPASIYFPEEFTEKSYGAAIYDVININTSITSFNEYKINKKTNQVPVSAAKTLRFNDYSQWSYFISMNNYLYVEKYLGLNLQNTTSSVLIKMKLSSSLIGINYAHSLNDSLKLGFHLSYKEINSEVFQLSKLETSGETMSSSDLNESQSNTLQPKFGLIYSFDQANDFALYFTTQRFNSQSYYNRFNIYVDTSGTVSDESESISNHSSILFSDQTSIGYNYKKRDIEVSFDFNQSTEPKESPINPLSDDYQKTKFNDYGFGLNYYLGQNIILAGYHKYEQQPFAYQLSLGFKTKRKNIEDVFGCYYFDSDNDLKIIRYGIFYSSMYTL